MSSIRRHLMNELSEHMEAFRKYDSRTNQTIMLLFITVALWAFQGLAQDWWGTSWLVITVRYAAVIALVFATLYNHEACRHLHASQGSLRRLARILADWYDTDKERNR